MYILYTVHVPPFPPPQSEEEKLAMERKVQLAEQAATIMNSTLHHDYERDNIQRHLGDTHLSDQTLSDRSTNMTQLYAETMADGEEQLPSSSMGLVATSETTTTSPTTTVSRMNVRVSIESQYVTFCYVAQYPFLNMLKHHSHVHIALIGILEFMTGGRFGERGNFPQTLQVHVYIK